MNAYDYVPAAMQAIDLIAEGKTETRACNLARISVAKFRKTVESAPELQELLTNAQALHLDALRDALLEIDASELGSSDARMAGVKAKNLQWYLERADRARYGQKTEVSVNLTADKAIIDGLARARLRVEGAVALAAPVIDGQFEVVEDAEDDVLAGMIGG